MYILSVAVLGIAYSLSPAHAECDDRRGWRKGLTTLETRVFSCLFFAYQVIKFACGEFRTRFTPYCGTDNLFTHLPCIICFKEKAKGQLSFCRYCIDPMHTHSISGCPGTTCSSIIADFGPVNHAPLSRSNIRDRCHGAICWAILQGRYFCRRSGETGDLVRHFYP